MKITAALILALTSLHLTPAMADTDKGTFYRSFSTDPRALNPLVEEDAYAHLIHTYTLDSLLARDENTWKYIPALATSFEVSKDGTIFTFKLRQGVKWSDGQPFTAEDVKYSFDEYFQDRFPNPTMKDFLSGIKEVKILDPTTVQFTTKELYFKNFNVAAEMTIVPKHFYEAGDAKDPKFNRELVGTGPYVLSEWAKGQKLVLKKNPTYWGKDLPYYKDRFHFQRILFRPIQEEAVELELIKKGDIDFLGLTPEQYLKKTEGPEWGTKLIKVKTTNSAPQNFTFGFIGWNETHPFFKDRDVRMALSQLVNRDFMIEKFLYGMHEKATGPFGNKSTASSPKVKAVEYNPKNALALLEKNGWKLGPNGLAKTIDGKETPFEFTVLNPNQDSEKYLTVIKEDMKKVGITMNIKLVEWNSFTKLLDERKFDAMVLAWQVSDLEDDPKEIWHSASIPSPGKNFISYSNPEVDKLIDTLRKTMNEPKRREMLHKLHEIIAADQPYSFLFNRKFTMYAHTSRIKKAQDTLKYAVGINTWMIKPE